MDYTQTLSYLYNSQPVFHLVGAVAYKPGFDNTLSLLKILEQPHTKFKSIHVAGTNGKGSTSHLIAAVLQKAGYRVGLYTSPHLVDFGERIRVNGQKIDPQYVVDFVAKYQTVLEEIKPSFFETTMAMAFKYFADKEVDVAVIEVGLGGRLDSTNVITPVLSVITNIGLDHVEFLGNTLPKIAAEKAGVIKSGVPVLIGETQKETATVFIAKAKEVGTEIFFADQEKLQDIDIQNIPCELVGIYQAKNKQTAYCALLMLRQCRFQISDQALLDGFAQVCTLTGLQGRWQILQKKPTVICDTGHNAHGIKYVVEHLSQYTKGTLHIIFGMVNDKDIDEVLKLLPKNAIYYFTQANTNRALLAEDLQQKAIAFELLGKIYPSVKSAYSSALSAANQEDIVFVGGSNFIVAEVLA